MLDGKLRSNVRPGSLVRIEKDSQRNGQLVEGIIKKVLTGADSHPHGIKVLLENGDVGRVKEIVEANKKSSLLEITSNNVEINLPKNEDQNTEFKATFRFDLKRFQITGVRSVNKEVEKSVSKTVAAFMNARGGTLYIGVNDSGNISGLEDDYKSLEKPNSDKLRLIIKNSLEGYLKNKIIFDYINLDFPIIDGKEICIIKVSPTPIPIFVHDGDKQECYVRVDNESKPYSYDEFIEYWQRHATKK